MADDEELYGLGAGERQRFQIPGFPPVSLGSLGAAKPATGPNAQRIAAKEAAVRKMRAERADQGRAIKAIYARELEKDLFQDPVTLEVFKAYPFTLRKADFTTSVNVANAETTIATYTVPNGMEFGFRAVQGGMSGINLDRQAPYLYTDIRDATPADILSGLLRIKIFDSTENELKGQAYTGDLSETNAADPIDWNKRCFFTTRTPVRAKGGDKISITLKSATVWVVANSDFVLRCLQLSRVR